MMKEIKCANEDFFPSQLLLFFVCAPRCRFFARSREMISCVYKFFSAGSHLADETTTLETLLLARFLLPPHIIRLTIKFFLVFHSLFFAPSSVLFGLR